MCLADIERIQHLFAATVAKIHVRGKREQTEEFDILVVPSALICDTMDMVGGRSQEA